MMSINNQISIKWINNIKKLDKKNHLKHGEFYANDGSVHDLEIDNNVVKAKVDGAPGDVYDVEINFKKLDKIDKMQISDFIYDNPLIYSKLINNQIPDDLLNLKVKILPDTVKDFKMTCSCKNGLFCKHKAAVFHKVKNEIAKDPFFIFTLRDLNLKEEIKSQNSPILNIDDVLHSQNVAVLNNSSDINYLNRLSFMLADYPSFYSSSHINFKEVLCEVLESMSKCIYHIQHPKVETNFNEYIILGNTLKTFEYFSSKSPDEIKKAFEGKWLSPQNWIEFRLNVDGEYNIDDITIGVDNVRFQVSDFKYMFFAFFAELNQINIDEYCEDIKFLYDVYLFTSQLIYLNALIPELFTLDNGYYHVHWIPAYEVSIFLKLKALYDNCPEDVLTFKGKKLSKQNQVNNLISLFFEGFSRYYVRKFMPHNLSMYASETYFRLFFLKNHDLHGFKYDGKELEVNNWLSVLYLKQKDYKFIIHTLQSDFEFVLDLKIEIDDETYTLKEILNEKRADIIRDMSIIQTIFLKFQLEYDFMNPQGLSLRLYSYFADNVAPALNSIGVSVNTPKEFSEVKRAKLILDGEVTETDSSLTLDNLVDFDWKIAIGDEIISIDEFKTFSKNFRGLVKIKDKYVNVNGDDLNQISEDLSKIPKDKNKSSLLQYLLSSDSENVEINERLYKLLEDTLQIKDFNIPDSLNGELRKYQKTGFSWLMQNIELGFGSILADDMGLGKTIQLLTTVLYLKENDLMNGGKVLVVAPTSILTNWVKEIEKFTPALKVEVYHGTNRHFPENDFDILLTSYGVLRQDYEDLNDENWFLMVIDEAQNIKNPKTKQTRAVKSIRADNYIAMSGTPIENHLYEYWSIFDFINKGYLHGLNDFRNRFINPIEKNRDLEALDDFKKITSPFILRRLKTDKNITKDLPEKIINDVYCNLTLKQASMYDETLNQLLRDVEDSEGIQRKGLVLKLITSLKQICNHPSQFSKSEKYTISDSGKMEVIIHILENIMNAGEKVLIFTQYVQMGNIMKELIEETFEEEVLFLHGGVSRTKRDRMIDKFQNEDAKIFILSLKAGGIGLNLTAAANVIHYDLWWNPAVENQATDRAYRIGQSDNVMVYRFITSGTLEERINQVLVEKNELAEMTIEVDESFITEMSNVELREMLNLRNNVD